MPSIEDSLKRQQQRLVHKYQPLRFSTDLDESTEDGVETPVNQGTGSGAVSQQGVSGLPRAREGVAPRVRCGASDWPDVTVVVLSDEDLRVEAVGFKQRYHYKELGFADRRTIGRPRKPWGLLLALARGGGELPPKSHHDPVHPNLRVELKKCVSDLRRILRKTFGINHDPFHPHTRKTGYRVRCRISDSREVSSFTRISAREESSPRKIHPSFYGDLRAPPASGHP
jgi:hypothetical protein